MSSSADNKRVDAAVATSTAAGGPAMHIPIISQLGARYPMYFPGTPLFYPPVVGAQHSAAAAMLQLRGIKAGTVQGGGQFSGVVIAPGGGAGGGGGVSSAVMASEPTNTIDSKVDSGATQGNIPSFFTAGGFPLQPVGIPMEHPMMGGLQIYSPIPAATTAPTPTAKSTPMPIVGDDVGNHWKHGESPPSSRGERASPNLLRVLPPRSALDHSTMPVDRLKNKRPSLSTVESRVKREVPAQGLPQGTAPSSSHGITESGLSYSTSKALTSTTMTGGQPVPMATLPVVTLPLTRLLFPPWTTFVVLPCVGGVGGAELAACRPALQVSYLLQNLFKPCLSSAPGGLCHAWNTGEQQAPLSLDACLHLTVLHLAQLRAGELLSAEKLRSLLFSAQSGEKARGGRRQGAGSHHSLVNHLTQMALYSAEGRVVVKEMEGNLMDGIRLAVHTLVGRVEASSKGGIPQPKFVVVVCSKEGRLSSFCIISCDHAHNKLLTSPPYRVTGEDHAPATPPSILSSRFENFLYSRLDSSKMAAPFLGVPPDSEGEDPSPLPEGVSTVHHRLPLSSVQEVVGVARCLYSPISDRILTTRGPFRSVDLAVLSSDPVLLASARDSVRASGLLQGLASCKNAQLTQSTDSCFLSLTGSPGESFQQLLERVGANRRCLFFVVLLQSEQFCQGLLPSGSSFLEAAGGRQALDQLQAAPNVLFLHLSQAPYALQTPLSLVPPQGEFTWDNCQASLYPRGGDAPAHPEGGGTHEHGPATIGIAQVDYHSDAYFENVYATKLPRRHKTSPMTTRARLLYEDYSKAIFQAVGHSLTPSPAPSNETMFFIQKLLTLPLRNTQGQGTMIVLRCPDHQLAQVFYKKLLEIRDGCGLKYRFELIMDSSSQPLTLSPHFLSRLRLWRFGANTHSPHAKDWLPSNYLDLEGLPCLVVLAGRCRGGLRFPRSLRYVDCRLCYGRDISRAMFECDMRLFPQPPAYWLSREQADTHLSKEAGSNSSKKPLKKEAAQNIQPHPLSEAHSKVTDNVEHTPGTPSADGRIRRDFSDLEDNPSPLSSGRRSNNPGDLDSLKESPAGVVEWRVQEPFSPDHAHNLLPPGGKSLSTDDSVKVGVAAECVSSGSKPREGGVVSHSLSSGNRDSPCSSTGVSTHQGFPAITLVTEAVEDVDMEHSGRHPWRSSLLASFVTQRQVGADREPSPRSGEVPGHRYDDSSTESDDDLSTADDEEAELAVGEEYLTIPRVCILSCTYQHIIEHQKEGVYPERLFLDPAPSSELNNTSKRQPLVSEDFHVGSAFYRKWTTSFCRACTFCRWVNAPRNASSGDKETTSKGADAGGSPSDGREKHLLLCGPPEVDKMAAVAQLVYAVYKEIFSMDKVTVSNLPLLPRLCLPAADATAQKEEFDPQVQELFKARAFSSIMSLSSYDNEGAAVGVVSPQSGGGAQQAGPRSEVELSSFAAYDARHSCPHCLPYLKGTSPDQQAVTEMLYTVKGAVSAQMQFFIPKTHLRHFEVDSASSRSANHYVLLRLRLPPVEGAGPGRRRVLTPIFTPTTGRHDVGLLNISHALEEEQHLHVLVLNQSEVTSYRHLWPNHVLMVLPDEERFKGYGAICYWVKKFITVNYEHHLRHHPPHRLWPYAAIMSDSCLMWKARGSAGAAPYSDDASLLQVLTTLEGSSEVQRHALVGLLPWAEELPAHLPAFSRAQVNHSLVLINVAMTTKTNYNRYLYNSADLDFNLHLESHGLSVARCNLFAMLRKPHRVGGRLSALQVGSDTQDFVVSLHRDAPSLLYYPGPLLMEEHLTHQGKHLFQLGRRRETPILVLDTFVNLGPDVHCVFVSTPDQHARPTKARCLETVSFGGALLYLCESFIPSARQFLQRVRFAEGASLCLVTRDCRSMVKDVARLDLDSQWKYQMRNEHQTACPDTFRPLFYLIRKYQPHN